DATETLLLAGASPFASSVWKAQPLHIAVSQNNLSKVKTLLSYDAPVDKRDKFGLTPLHIACIGGYNRVVRELLQGGA
ncbi:ankyrin repeat protein, partial [Trematosphaeria pertusa]